MKRPRPPKSKEEVINYIREKNLCVDPDFFWTYFTEGDWHDKNGDSVLNWKQKLLTWHRKAIERIRPHKCSYPGCRKPGVYPNGYDRDGHPYFLCIDHKPKPKSVLPKELTEGILKPVPKDTRDFNQKKNDAMKKLVYNEMEIRRQEVREEYGDYFREQTKEQLAKMRINQKYAMYWWLIDEVMSGQ